MKILSLQKAIHSLTRSGSEAKKKERKNRKRKKRNATTTATTTYKLIDGKVFAIVT